MIASNSNSHTIKDDWNTHWKNYSTSAQSNPAQAYRRRLIFSNLKLTANRHAIRILDIGSGQGDFAMDLARSVPQAKILGIELSQSGVAISQAKVPQATFIEQDLNIFKAPPPEFQNWATHAVCSEVLEHTDRPEIILNHIQPYLAPGCQLLITLPGGPMSQFDHHIGHRKHYKISELKRLLEKSGYRVKQISGGGFPFFNLYRFVVIARGKSLIQDVKTSASSKMSLSARIAMKIFSFLFHFNLSRSRWGWQIFAIAEKL